MGSRAPVWTRMSRTQSRLLRIVHAALASSFLKENNLARSLYSSRLCLEHMVVAGELWPHSPTAPPLWVRAKVEKFSGDWELVCGQGKGAGGGIAGKEGRI